MFFFLRRNEMRVVSIYREKKILNFNIIFIFFSKKFYYIKIAFELLGEKKNQK